MSAVLVLGGGSAPFSSILRMIFALYFSETSHVWEQTHTQQAGGLLVRGFMRNCEAAAFRGEEKPSPVSCCCERTGETDEAQATCSDCTSWEKSSGKLSHPKWKQLLHMPEQRETGSSAGGSSVENKHR